jgi:sugar lactone lactonase YvrE
MFCAGALLTTNGLLAQSYSFSTLIGRAGLSDGVASVARFSAQGIALDRTGNIYIGGGSSDATIRKLTHVGTNWVVSTLAGQMGTPGTADGTGSQARFVLPNGLGVDSAGNIYVTDQYFGESMTSFRKITPAGVVSTLARYTHPGDSPEGWGVALDASDNVYMSEFGATSVTVRKITPDGSITIWATLDFLPAGMAFDQEGNLYLADTQRSIIRKITPDGVESTFAGQSDVMGSVDGTGSDALFGHPLGLTTDGSGNIYVGDETTIRKITPDGVVTTLAGQAGTFGTADGTAGDARFSSLGGLAADGQGNIYVADGDAVRVVTPAGVVTTIAGRPYQPYSGGVYQIYGSGIAADTGNNLYFSDGVSNLIYKITPNGDRSVLASVPVPGVGALAVDLATNVYVVANGTIQKITLTGVVTTLAGQAGISGSADGKGASASFNNIQSIVADSTFNIYVADTANYTIRRITPDGTVSTLAGLAGVPGKANGTGSAARFGSIDYGGPTGVATDKAGNIYVADQGNSTIRKVTPSGAVTTLAGSAGIYGNVDGTGSAALFNQPGGVAVDSTGNVYVADTYNYTIRKITPVRVVTTIAGKVLDYYNGADVDGPVDLVRFSVPSAITLDMAGNIYVSEFTKIRKGTPIASLPTVALGSLSQIAGSFAFCISGASGQTVAVESSLDLSAWNLIGMYRLDGGTNLFISPTPIQARQFYRARQ